MQPRIIEQLRALGIARAPEVAALATPSLRIRATRCPLSRLAIGESRFGGEPDVPGDFAWPVRDGRPLTFLAQLDLRVVRAPDLPRSGWLVFFYDCQEQPWGYDPKEGSGAHVAHIGARKKLVRTRAPRTARVETFKPCRLSFERVIDLPGQMDSLVWEQTRGLTSEQWDAYAAVAAKVSGVDEGAPYHHVLGHPQHIQDDMRRQCAMVAAGIYCGKTSAYQTRRARALFRQAPSWRLLLQLDTDEARPGWMWGDDGRLYFWIRRDQLARRQFGSTWCVLQSG
jgi:uncharacterized protein YwqG